jgi:hypothetical protein
MKARLKRIDKFTDRHGKQRYYVRVDGVRYPLPDPGEGEEPSAAFVEAYDRAISGHTAFIRARRKVTRNPDFIGTIYVAGFDRFVKIGFTGQSVAERIRTLSTGSPLPITVHFTLPGSVLDERALHDRFAAYRLRGEWFELRGEVLAWVEESRTTEVDSQPIEKFGSRRVADQQLNGVDGGLARSSTVEFHQWLTSPNPAQATNGKKRLFAPFPTRLEAASEPASKRIPPLRQLSA